MGLAGCRGRGLTAARVLLFLNVQHLLASSFLCHLQEVLLAALPKHILPFDFLFLDLASLTGSQALVFFTVRPAASARARSRGAEGTGFEHAELCLSILLPKPHYDIVDIPLERASLPTPSLFY